MSAFSILTLTCRLGRYSERPSLFFFCTIFVVANKGAMPDWLTASPPVAARLVQTRTAIPQACRCQL